MSRLATRHWNEPESTQFVQKVLGAFPETPAAISGKIYDLAKTNRDIHDRLCFNLNPASNVMNPAAERILAAGLGSRPSLGNPGAKNEAGVEAIQEIEVYASELAARVFDADYVEARCQSGALANLYTFMALAKPGDAIIAPDPAIGGHVTHFARGGAGLYQLTTHAMPYDAESYSIDLEGLRALALKVRPKIITLGGSFNLQPDPVREVRAIADEVGAWVMFDAAHQSGLIAGKRWANPLAEGAHVMTMSTYKSLGGPPSGLIVTNEADIAQRLEAIAYPGLTANFDAARSAALAISLLDWIDHGPAYAKKMQEVAAAFAAELWAQGLPVYATARGASGHQLAIPAEDFGGAADASRRLRQAGLLASGCTLPPVGGEPRQGIRLGTPEIVRRGMDTGDMSTLASLMARALVSTAPETLAGETAAFRGEFRSMHYINHYPHLSPGAFQDE